MPDAIDALFTDYGRSCWTKEVPLLRRKIRMPRAELADEVGGVTVSQLDAIESALRATYFAGRTEEYLHSDDGQLDLRNHVYFRYWKTRTTICPWLERCGDMSGVTAVEVGCGTGSSTAAFAQIVDRVHAFEISPPSVQAARSRLATMGIENATVHLTPPDRLIDAISASLQRPVQMFVLFAVLEHMTIPERIQALRHAMEILEPGGILVIGETPNRLTYFDRHTARMPFFHMLPDELAVDYACRSSRKSFAGGMNRAAEVSTQAAIQRRIRSGTGVSFHEFEVALGHDVHRHVELTGHEPEIIACAGPTPEEAILHHYLHKVGLEVSPAFHRDHLYMVIRKADR